MDADHPSNRVPIPCRSTRIILSNWVAAPGGTVNILGLDLGKRALSSQALGEIVEMALAALERERVKKGRGA